MHYKDNRLKHAIWMQYKGTQTLEKQYELIIYPTKYRNDKVEEI